MKAFVLSLSWSPMDYSDSSFTKPIKVFMGKPTKAQLLKAIRPQFPPNTAGIILMVCSGGCVDVDYGGGYTECVSFELLEVECCSVNY